MCVGDNACVHQRKPRESAGLWVCWTCEFQLIYLSQSSSTLLITYRG